ncbi:cyclin-B2-4-like [Pyrus communis]|uniref:cyclin-B2-4-like n=1 Tax=Pyrus communis TaxID=23211 RepID=UPI0035C09078
MRFAQLLQQQPKETKEVSVSSFAANPKAVENIEDEACDAHVPMFVKHTQEEDENVEDEDPIMDSSSSKDPLNFVKYIADIYAHYGETEMSFETESTA